MVFPVLKESEVQVACYADIKRGGAVGQDVDKVGLHLTVYVCRGLILRQAQDDGSRSGNLGPLSDVFGHASLLGSSGFLNYLFHSKLTSTAVNTTNHAVKAAIAHVSHSIRLATLSFDLATAPINEANLFCAAAKFRKIFSVPSGLLRVCVSS